MVTTDEVRSLALSLPEAEEREHWDKPSFRVRNKIFAVIQPDGKSVVVKTTKEDRAALAAMDPETFQLPAGFENTNYMLVRLDFVKREEIRGLLVQAWKLVSPKSLVKALEGQANE